MEATHRVADRSTHAIRELMDRLSGSVVVSSYDDAHERLATGKGNAIRQAEMPRDRGVKAIKQLPKPLTDEARGELSAVEELALIAYETTPSGTLTRPSGSA